LDYFEKKLYEGRTHGALPLGNQREVIGEFVFLDNEKMIAIGFDPRLRNLCIKKLAKDAPP